MAGYYGGNSCDGVFPNMVDAIAASGSFHVTTALALPSVTSSDTAGVAAAAALAKAAEYAYTHPRLDVWVWVWVWVWVEVEV